MKLNRNKAAFLITMFLLISAAYACTIGVASPDITSNGRAMLWKTRDIGSFPDNFLDWNQDSVYSFLYVRDSRDSLAWMGVNDQGFCIANSFVQRQVEDRPIFNNGLLIYYLLGNCASIEQMDALLDTLDITSQVLSGNFGVIDASGAAAVYEISWNQVQKYDAAQADEGYIIRTNFSLITGGDEGIERYNRSQDIINNLAAEDNLNANALIQQHFRDFSDEDSQQIDIPFYDRWFYDRPWGYIKTNDSICRAIAASAAVFTGVLPDEPPQSTSMYALLGNPATSVFLPYFPIDEPPHQATNITGMQLTTAANHIKEAIFNFTENSYYIDSFNLYQPDEEKIFDIVLPFDQQMYDATEQFLIDWRNGNAQEDDALVHSEYWVNAAMAELDSVQSVISHEVIADFDADIYSGGYPLTVNFYDQTIHNPTDISWDFDNNGTIDASNLENVSWVYSQPGDYSVRLLVSNNSSSQELIKENFIHVNQSPVTDNELPAYPSIIGCYPNPLSTNLRSCNPRIQFYLPEAAAGVMIDLFSITGRKVKSHTFADTLAPGYNSWYFDGIDKKGNLLPSGVYLYRLKVPGYRILSNKLVITR